MSGSGSPGSPTDAGPPGPSVSPGAPEPPTGPGPRDAGIAGARYSRNVAIVALVLLVAFILHVVLSGHKGVTGILPGTRVPPFAAPFAAGGPVGEVDVATHADEGSAGRVPACAERGHAILNICELYERGPVVLALFFDAGSCAGFLADFQQLADAFPQVGFAAVAVRQEAAPIARLVRAKRLTVPVGVDAEGRLAALYTMVSCPQITFLYPGGVVQSAALLGSPSPATLRARVGELLTASRKRGWNPGRLSR